MKFEFVNSQTVVPFFADLDNHVSSFEIGVYLIFTAFSAHIYFSNEKILYDCTTFRPLQ